MKGVQPGKDGKIVCKRCGKRMAKINFYTYRDGSQCQICKPCLTAHIDNFDVSTFEWILKDMDVPYIPAEWNVLRDKAFAKDPYKMNGMSVIGKYLAKMKLKQWSKYHYQDSEALQKQAMDAAEVEEQAIAEEKAKYEAQLKTKLNQGQISLAEYQTLVSTETQNQELYDGKWGNEITGQVKRGKASTPSSFVSNPSSYEEALNQIKNPYQENNFLPEEDLVDLGADLSKDDKLFLAMKWGRLYRPSQWVALEKLYNDFMNSFDIQGAGRIDTLKMICKTSLKMNQAIDCGDIDSYQKLSRVYDAMMKSAKFTEAQNRDGNGDSIDSASAIVDFVEANDGAIPRYECKEPQDLIDKIILDLKEYNRSLIYEDKSLAQEIEKYLQDKKNSEAMRKDRQQAYQHGLLDIELQDEDFMNFKDQQQAMKIHDAQLDDLIIEHEAEEKRVKH